jgi:hypothetical protein
LGPETPPKSRFLSQNLPNASETILSWIVLTEYTIKEYSFSNL